ncbi:MAG: extracellular solute-binding protein [Phycisphaerales bacterium]|nr:extracellular solute-binding protein [Phycisphaerales bacterium]
MTKFIVFALSICMLCGCDRSESVDTQPTLTLYTSVDDQFAKLVVDAFTQETGITVHILGDTEATKTTGLVTRIQAEMDHPIADVWWSSEPMGTILLDQAGAFEPNAMQGMVGDDWPDALHASNWSWVGMAMRSRVIAYATDRVDNPPTTLAQLTDPKYKGIVGMARPQFGTTRIHMAMLADQWGVDALHEWLEAMNANKLRLYDGNASVVQAIALGEIDVGLTDTDDVWSGQRNGWKVDLVYESHAEHPDWPSIGPALIPNTVAIINGAPHRALATQLAAFLVSPTVEELLYQSTTHNTPIHPALRVLYKDDVLEIDRLPDYIGASGKVREAMDVCDQVLISP